MNGIIDYSYYLHSSSSAPLLYRHYHPRPLPPLHPSFMVGKSDPAGDNGGSHNGRKEAGDSSLRKGQEEGERGGTAMTQLYPVLSSYSSASPGFASGMCGSVGQRAPGRRLCSGDRVIPARSTSTC